MFFDSVTCLFIIFSDIQQNYARLHADTANGDAAAQIHCFGEGKVLKIPCIIVQS